MTQPAFANRQTVAVSDLFRSAAELLRAHDPQAAQLLARLEQFLDYGPGWLMISEVLEAEKQPSAAALAYRRSALAQEASCLILYRAGRGLMRLGRSTEAVAAFHRAIDSDPCFAPARYSLGLALQDQRDFAAAATAYREACRLRPDFHEARFNLAVVLQEDGRLEEALDAYAAAFALKPASFGRIAQALVSTPIGLLFLRHADLRHMLMMRGAR